MTGAGFDPATTAADVIIVGSGAAGSMAAWSLTKAGLRCLMLEAGRDYDPQAEVNMMAPESDAPLRGASTPDKPFGYFDATVGGGWEVEGEPYTMREGTDFRWYRSRMLGGRTNHWGRHAPRWGPYDFKPFSRDGLGVDWPIGYDDVAPFYDRVERMIGVNGGRIELENHPDSPPGCLMPPPKPRIPEMLLKATCESMGIPVRTAHTAVITRDMPDKVAPRSACFNATPCGRGCTIGAMFQTTTSFLPMAKATGRLTIVTDAMVSKVLMASAGRAEGVEYVDRKTGARHKVKARAVIVAGGTCETTRLLLNSGDKPGGLANSSGQLGRNLTDSTGASFRAFVPALAGRPRYNEDGIGGQHVYIPFWLYQEQKRGELDFARGYHFEIGGRFGIPPAAALPRVWGADLKKAVRTASGATIGMTLRGEMIPNKDTWCEIDPGVKDRFGIPVLRFAFRWSQHELNQVAHGQRTAHAVFKRMNATILDPELPPEKLITAGGEIIHELGTARMGADARSSVVDSYGQTWDVGNLVLMDGAIFASGAHKNPTLTILALALRASERLAARFKSGALA
ncbi:choline dehydrogenase-like flavoprotein [Sphingomonas naasensis]|uniref:GMC family oxidoreductase n=1 Tax=Sphingomonas naasensis TaxID=1344951 RepID=A0A4S1WWT4_9SPHN|nr:GMC family oxidoreductase [Sphingomonas naasensis]NIJ18819.1 choline dehydrogenase-like flavoprotein [Sphingomonas naasensis]TGX46046.1 GMC family oxidoreductase [Sphingomonas naasensis]